MYFLKLPQELIRLIYEYDDTYTNFYKKCTLYFSKNKIHKADQSQLNLEMLNKKCFNYYFYA